MKVLVFTHRLELGGSQTNAIDLAAAARDLFGHEVVLFGEPGPAAELARRRDLELIPAPGGRRHPSPAVIRALRSVAARTRPDVIHAWDWPQCVDAQAVEHAVHRTPLFGTIASMGVTRAVPSGVPVAYMTPQLVEQARALGRWPVSLLEPPVDTDRDSTDAVDPAPFARAHGLEDGRVDVVVVSRLNQWMKLDGILRAVDAVAALAATHGVRLVIVGDGDSVDTIRARAESSGAPPGAVVLTGPLDDPRPAYAHADIVLGMGSSALRAMAFAKPLIVLGELGFSAPFDADTAPGFLHAGFWGTGANGSLRDQLERLVVDAELRGELGRFGCRIVTERFAVPVVAAAADRAYRQVVEEPVSRAQAIVNGARASARQAVSASLPSGVRDRLRPTAGRQW